MAVAVIVTGLAGKLYSQQGQKGLMGVVDLLKISQSWKKWGRLEEHLQDEEKSFKEKVEEMGDEIAKKEKELKSLKAGSIEYQKTEIEFLKKRSELKNYSLRKGDELKKKMEKYMRELVQNMESEIKTYGRVNRFTLIIKKQSVSIEGYEWRALQNYILNKSVMWYAPNIDITGPLAKILNQKYK
jgi:Skp family chaperone for outer membrane proteins